MADYAAHGDGGLTVRRAGGGGVTQLPAEYVAEHVELAYATTAHRAQGRTVDTAHAIVSSNTTREVLYVAATRGRQCKQLCVDVVFDPDAATGHRGAVEHQTARDVLVGVLEREGADVAAHAAIRASLDSAESIPRLHAEYLTIRPRRAGTAVGLADPASRSQRRPGRTGAGI